MEAELSYGGHYTDIELVVSAEEITDTAVVNAVTLTTSDGTEYALRHVEHIWRKTDLGWNWEELDGNGLSGKTITNVTYYLKDTKTDENGTEETVYGIYSYDVNLTVKLNAGEVTAESEDGTESETPAESEDDTESETPAESESSTESANQSESAQTGDSSNMILWMVLMMSCVAAIALIQVKRRSDMEQE